MSKRQDIVDAIAARMRTITTANGYSVNLESYVDVWRSTTYPDSLTVALNIKDGSSQSMQPNHTFPFVWGLAIDIDISVQAGSVSVAQMRSIIGDVLKAVGTDPKWGGLAEYTEQPSDNMKVNQEATIISGAQMSMKIVYSCNQWEQ